MIQPGSFYIKSKSEIEIHPVSAAVIRPLRRELLRPAQTPEELVYSGDEAPDTLHLGAFLDGTLVGIASICQEPIAGNKYDKDMWRLRGMAVRPEVRRKGYGRRLLKYCIDYVTNHEGKAIWCNVRIPAIDFYCNLGFEINGSEFDIPGIGPHVIMTLSIR